MIIDAHAHLARPEVIPKRFLDGWIRNIEVLASGARRSERGLPLRGALVHLITGDPDGSELLSQMDEAGIDKTVLLVVDFGFAFEECRDLLPEIYDLHRRLMQREPRFLCFAGVDPRRGKEGEELVERSLRDWGFCGLKLYPPCGFSPSDARVFPYYEICTSYGAPVLTHLGPSSASLSFQHTRPEDIDQAAHMFPDTNFILAHGAVVHQDGAALLARFRPNVFLDVSGFPLQRQAGGFDHVMGDLMAQGLERKLLFGTDWPFFRMAGSQKSLVEQVRSMVSRRILSERQCDLLLHANAASVLRSLPEQVVRR